MPFLNRTLATANISSLDESSYDALFSTMNLNTSYTDAANSSFNYSDVLSVVLQPYSNSLGPFALLLVFAMPFVGLWILQRDTLMPGIMGLIFGSYVLAQLPADYQAVSVTILAVSVTAVVYSLMTRRIT